MSEKWESESLSWIHAVRKRNYEKTKGKSLAELSPGPGAKTDALIRKLKLQRVAVRTLKKTATKRRVNS
jgi:hypothetical protein